jgi:hypothetical protein
VTEVCLANDAPETFNEGVGDPAPGTGLWYLLRAQPGGSFDSGGPGQFAPRDAAIFASGNGCP